MASSQTSEAATLSGAIAFEGEAPAVQKIQMGADPSCMLLHPDSINSDNVIVNENGSLKNVFVYVKEGVSGKFDTPKEAVIFDQVGCLYSPKIFGIQTNQPLEIRNSDNTLHNVHALSKNNPQFNLGMPIKGMKLKKKFKNHEVMLKIKCEVHPWMAAYAGVLEHPFFAVTGDNGQFQIKDLPAGEYVIEAWHEVFGTQTQSVSIGADADEEIYFQFKS